MSEISNTAPTREVLILREQLAVDRTELANERTLLAYVRTALTLFVLGVSFLKIPLFDSTAFSVQGWTFIPLGIVTIVVGTVRYRHVRQRVRRMLAEWAEPS